MTIMLKITIESAKKIVILTYTQMKGVQFVVIIMQNLIVFSISRLICVRHVVWIQYSCSVKRNKDDRLCPRE